MPTWNKWIGKNHGKNHGKCPKYIKYPNYSGIYIYISITSTWDSWEILLDDWKNGDFSQVLERTLRIVDVERKTHV